MNFKPKELFVQEKEELLRDGYRNHPINSQEGVKMVEEIIDKIDVTPPLLFSS